MKLNSIPAIIEKNRKSIRIKLNWICFLLFSQLEFSLKFSSNSNLIRWVRQFFPLNVAWNWRLQMGWLSWWKSSSMSFTLFQMPQDGLEMASKQSSESSRHTEPTVKQINRFVGLQNDWFRLKCGGGYCFSLPRPTEIQPAKASRIS